MINNIPKTTKLQHMVTVRRTSAGGKEAQSVKLGAPLGPQHSPLMRASRALSGVHIFELYKTTVVFVLYVEI